MATKLFKNRVYDVSFICRPLNFEAPEDCEQGEFRAYWTGEVDTWGKYTFIPTDGGEPTYLFRDEFTFHNPQGDI